MTAPVMRLLLLLLQREVDAAPASVVTHTHMHTCMKIKNNKKQSKLGWLGGSVVRALARDRKVASSTPGQSATE